MTCSSQRLTYCTNQSPEQRELNHLLPFPSLSPSDGRRKGYMATQQSNNGGIQRFLKGDGKVYFHPKDLVYSWGGVTPSPIPIPNPRRVRSHLKIFSQPLRHNINHRSHTISIIMAPGSERYQLQTLRKSTDRNASYQPGV